LDFLFVDPVKDESAILKKQAIEQDSPRARFVWKLVANMAKCLNCNRERDESPQAPPEDLDLAVDCACIQDVRAAEGSRVNFFF
jgi:hypothetical protein